MRRPQSKSSQSFIAKKDFSALAIKNSNWGFYTGFRLDGPAANALFSSFDSQRKGSIGLPEYIGMTLFLQSAAVTFRAFDPQNTGHIQLSFDQVSLFHLYRHNYEYNLIHCQWAQLHHIYFHFAFSYIHRKKKQKKGTRELLRLGRLNLFACVSVCNNILIGLNPSLRGLAMTQGLTLKGD